VSMRNNCNNDSTGETGESGAEIGMLLHCIALRGLVFAIVSPPCRQMVDLWKVFIAKVLQGISPVSPLSPREVLF